MRREELEEKIKKILDDNFDESNKNVLDYVASKIWEAAVIPAIEEERNAWAEISMRNPARVC
jgi:predicted lipoprotein